MSNELLTDELSAPLDGATTASVDIHSGSGNLTIDELPEDEQLLASGSLEYFEKQGKPTRSITSDRGEAKLTLQGADSGQPWFRFPWAACTGATQWQIHLNRVVSDISAHTGGGNVKLNLAGMAVSHVSADSGGGNMEVVLPEHAANLGVAARTGGGNITVEIGSQTTGSNAVEANSGAGNVVVRVPHGMAARVHARSGLGKVMVDSPFSRIDGQTYQSADYDAAVDKVEITVSTGAGNVTVNAM
ncbi:MAG TPA: LiaF domain-containing protein [Chloroflexota bacterium]